MAETFKNGDVVQLKSGGPKMTVNGSMANGSLHCVWFDKDLNVSNANFFSAALVKAD
jgi:uncharacterized protein YodC (DUF2158 family)